jgi:hypothetical protein
MINKLTHLTLLFHTEQERLPSFTLELSLLLNPVAPRGAPAPLRGPIPIGDSPQVGGASRPGGAYHAAV